MALGVRGRSVAKSNDSTMRGKSIPPSFGKPRQKARGENFFGQELNILVETSAKKPLQAIRHPEPVEGSVLLLRKMTNGTDPATCVCDKLGMTGILSE